MSHDGTQAIDQLGEAADQIAQVAETFLWAGEDARITELYRAGSALTRLTHVLAEITGHLVVTAESCAESRVLRDHSDGDRHARLGEAITHLQAAGSSYIAAAHAATAYHSLVCHIAADAPDGGLNC